MRLITGSKILKGIAVALILVAWLATDDLQVKFIFVCTAYVVVSMAWYMVLKAAETRQEVVDSMLSFTPELFSAAVAAKEYDLAIRKCSNDPEKMASFCTSQGDTLDTLYDNWQTKTMIALSKASVFLDEPSDI